MKDNFIEELRELCKKYDVSLYGGCYEEVIVKTGYDETFINDIRYSIKNLTQPEK